VRNVTTSVAADAPGTVYLLYVAGSDRMDATSSPPRPGVEDNVAGDGGGSEDRQAADAKKHAENTAIRMDLHVWAL
jgi:hypothetical protein